jgi:phage protein D
VSIGLYSPKVTLDGSPLKQDLYEILLDVRVMHDLHAPSMATLRLVDPFFDLLDSTTFKLGAKLEVAFPSSAGSDTTVFKGVVAAVGSEQGAGDRHELVVTAFDGSQVLTRTVAPISYQEMTVSDIVGKIAKTHGLSPQVKDADAKLDYFLQVDTDYMTLNELAARCGTEWWVDDTKLHFAKRKVETATKLEWGDNLRRLSARFTAGGHVEEVTVRGWDPATQKAVVGTVKRSAIASGDTGHDVPIQTDRVSQAKDLKGAITITELQVASAEEAKAIAQSRLADLTAGELRVRGEAYGTPAIAAGKTVEIAKAGKQMSGKFVITRVEHVFGVDRPLISRFEAGGWGPVVWPTVWRPPIRLTARRGACSLSAR